MGSFTWNGDAVADKFRSKLASNITNASGFLQERMAYTIGIQGPPRSKAGEAPHIDTGKLIESLYVEMDAESLVARIGTTVEYGAYLERGTDRMAPRPWCLSSLKQTKDELRQIMTTGSSIG